MGYYCAQKLLRNGYTVYLLCRDIRRGHIAAQSLQKQTGNRNCEVFYVDLENLNTVYAFINIMKTKDLTVAGIINNAGMIGTKSMMCNHVGHFALTIGLLPMLLKGVSRFGSAYVCNVASVAHYDGMFSLSRDLSKHELLASSSSDAWTAYAASKAANVLFSHSFSKHLSGLGIFVTSYHPGVMLSDLWRSTPSSQRPAAEELISSEVNDIYPASSREYGPSDTAVTGEPQRRDSSSASGGSDGGHIPEAVRLAAACCVKHPCIGATGAVSLVSPPVCLHELLLQQTRPWCCFQQCVNEHRTKQTQVDETAKIKELRDSLVWRLRTWCCTGSSGGYYQQCLCCCVLPVRASPLAYSSNLEDLLWAQSLHVVHDAHAELHALLQAALSAAARQTHCHIASPDAQSLLGGRKFSVQCPNATSLGDGDASTRVRLINPALPCTEWLSVSPYCCCCIACLC